MKIVSEPKQTKVWNDFHDYHGSKWTNQNGGHNYPQVKCLDECLHTNTRKSN